MALEVVSEHYEPQLQYAEVGGTPAQPPPAAKASLDARVINVLNVLVPILAVRVMILAALIGAAILTYAVLPNPSVTALWALGIYNGFIVLPLIWLASRRS